MPVICPTVTAINAEEYKQQIDHISSFVERVHLDFSDGEFAPVSLINPIQAWWPSTVLADFHLMYKHPLGSLDTVMSLHPHMVIVHAEAKGDIKGMLNELHNVGIRTGLALLKPSKPKHYKKLIELVDHVLIFSGDLGHFGGAVDTGLFPKIHEVLEIHPHVEIGWDGGINAENVAQLVSVGVDVLDVGGFIQQSPNPQGAYDILNDKVTTVRMQ